MKKLLTLFSLVFLLSGFMYSQNNDVEVATLVKQIGKSDADIQNPKKNTKYQTWAKRSDLFLKAYTINSKFLYQNLEASTIPLLGISDNSPTPYYGKYLSSDVEGDFTVWTYSKIKIYITADGLVDHWEETVPVDTLAIEKSYEAIVKAIELDGSNKYKNKKSTKQQIAEIREHLMNKAVKVYYAGQTAKALDLLDKSISLFQYPRTSADTLAQIGVYYYYAGIFAYNAKEFDRSVGYFQKSVENYEPSNSAVYNVGTSYQYMSQVLFEKGDTTQAVQLLEDGADKYPQESKIIYSLIDYYTPIGEYDKAFKYLDKAINMTPDNAVLYVVKANSYEKIYQQFEASYFKLLLRADSLDKAEYRFRSDANKVAELKKEKNDILTNLVPVAKKDMEDYAQKTIDAYKKGISLDTSKTSDFTYSLSNFYYTRAVSFKKYSSSIRKLVDIITELSTSSKEMFENAKDYGLQSLAFDENDVYTLTLLAKIYYQLGDTDTSQKYRDRANAVNN